MSTSLIPQLSHTPISKSETEHLRKPDSYTEVEDKTAVDTNGLT